MLLPLHKRSHKHSVVAITCDEKLYFRSHQGWTGHWDYREFPGGLMAQWAGFSDSGPLPPSAPLSLPPCSAHLGGTKKQGEDQRSMGDDRGAWGTTEEHGGRGQTADSTAMAWEFLTSA